MARRADPLELALVFLRRTGVFNSNNILRLFSTYFMLPVTLAMIGLVVQQFSVAEGDMFNIIAIFEAIVTIVEGLARKFILLKNSKFMNEILEDRKLFWSYHMYEDCVEKMRFSHKMLQALITFSVCTAIFTCASCIPQGHSVPMMCWLPEQKSLRILIFLLQVIIFAEVVNSFGALDGFFLILATEIRIQFILLQRKLESIDFGKNSSQHCFDQLVICSKHHNLLLSVHKKLNYVYSLLLFYQYCVSVVGLAVQIYIALYAPTGVTVKAKSVLYIFALMVQCGMYFMPASLAEEEAERFAMKIYEINWEVIGDKRIYKHLIFMMTNAQEPLQMLGGGTIHINKPEYIAVFRVGFSISTVFRGMSEL